MHACLTLLVVYVFVFFTLIRLNVFCLLERHAGGGAGVCCDAVHLEKLLQSDTAGKLALPVFLKGLSLLTLFLVYMNFIVHSKDLFFFTRPFSGEMQRATQQSGDL